MSREREAGCKFSERERGLCLEMRSSGEFTFHGVGQGLFYTGVISIDGMQRRIVYDCGSFFKRELLEHEIDVSFNPNDTIDLLVISHMDADHINGLRYLLDRVRQVKYLFMPYTEPEEMAFLAVKYTFRRVQHKDYIDTLLSFEDIINDNKIQNIIMLTDSEGSEDSIVSEGNRLEDISVKFRRNIEKQKIIDNALPDKKIQVARYDGLLSFPMVWIFRFYVQDDGQRDRKKFHDSLIGRNIKISSFRGLRKIWESKEQLAELKAAYKDIHKNMNLTSLVLLHKPYEENKSFFTKVFMHGFCRRNWLFPWCHIRMGGCNKHNARSTIIFGDARLRSKKACEEIKKYFSADLEDCVIALVPHHGSKNNCGARILKYIDSKCWVVSFGIHGRFGHPDTEVLNVFGKSWKHSRGCAENERESFPWLLFCNEYQEVQYEIMAGK